MHLKSDNREIVSHDKANEVIEELFQSLLSRYQTGLETLVVSLSLIVFICCFYVMKFLRIIYRLDKKKKKKQYKIPSIKNIISTFNTL